MAAILIGLASSSALADDASRLAELDRLLGEGEAAGAADAASLYLEAGDVEPWNLWRFRQRLGVALIAAGQPADAVSVLELAMADAPQEPALHLSLGRALRDIGHGGRAVAEFGAAVNLAPQRHAWRLEYADALLAIGVRRDALVQIREARALCQDCAEALRGEVNYHLTMGNAAATVEPLRTLQAREPAADTRRLLVLTLWNLGDVAAVAAVLDSVPEDHLDGDDLALLLDVDRRLGRTERALRWVHDDSDAVRRVARPLPETWALVSEICLAGGEPAAALVAIDRAVAAAPTTAVHHHNRAAILVALGRQDEARRALSEANRLDPHLGRSP